MITPEQELFNTQVETLTSALPLAYSDETVNFFYGRSDFRPTDIGWWLTATDYPGYEVWYLGYTFEEALATLDKWRLEHDDEEDED